MKIKNAPTLQAPLLIFHAALLSFYIGDGLVECFPLSGRNHVPVSFASSSSSFCIPHHHKRVDDAVFSSRCYKNNHWTLNKGMKTTTSTMTRLNMVGMNNFIPTATTTMISAVEYFDGSTITDPVVKSNMYWMTLQSQFVNFMIVQAVATVAFIILASLLSNQINKLSDQISSEVFKEGVQTKVQDIISNASTSSSTARSSISMTTNIDITKLVICIVIDLIGSASEFVPIVGEIADIVWAPIAAYLLRSLYGNSNVVFVLEFIEEILPFTDILPLASLCWVIDTFFRDTDIAKLLQIGNYRRIAQVPNTVPNDSEIIDVSSSSSETKKKID